MKNQLTRILQNLNKYLLIKYLGNDFNIYEMDKSDIKNIISGMKECDKENAKNNLWLNDRMTLVNYINDWCVVYRCYSLVQR